MRAVNLLPRDEARSGPGLPSPWVLLAAAVPVVAGSLVYLGYSTEHATVADKRAELAAVQTRLDQFTAKQAGLQAQGDLVGLRSKRQAAFQDALSKSTAWNVMLNDLARVLPKGVSLTNLSAQSPTPSASKVAAATSSTSASPAPAPLPTSFTIVGTANSHDQIAQLLARLSLLPMLTNVTLTSTSTVTPSTATAATSTSTGEKAPAKKAGPPQVSFFVSAGIVPLGQGAST